jgi:hypothetical protein
LWRRGLEAAQEVGDAADATADGHRPVTEQLGLAQAADPPGS